MAKKTLKISNLSGGVNNFASPRDIDETQLTDAYNINVSQPGLIKSSGAPIVPTTPETASLSGAPVAGTGFYSYSSDYKAAEYIPNVIAAAANSNITSSANWDVSDSNWTLETDHLKFTPSGTISDDSADISLAVDTYFQASGIIASRKYILMIYVEGGNYVNNTKLYIKGGAGFFLDTTSTSITEDGWYHFEFTSHSAPAGDALTIYGQADSAGGNIKIYSIRLYLMTTPENINYKLLYDSGDNGIDTYIDTGATATSHWMAQSQDYDTNNLQLTNGSTAEPVFTTVDGNLRVTDANFDNTNLPRWRGYVNKSLFGTIDGKQGVSGSSQSNYYLPGFYNYSSIIKKPEIVTETQTFTTDGTAPSMATSGSYIGLKTEFLEASDVDYLAGRGPGNTLNGIAPADYSTDGDYGGGALNTDAQAASIAYYDHYYIGGQADALGENFAAASAGVANHSTDEGYFLYTKNNTKTTSGSSPRVGNQYVFKLGTNNFRINWANGDKVLMEIKGFGQASDDWTSLTDGDTRNYYMWLTIMPNDNVGGIFNDIQTTGFNFRSVNQISKSWANDGEWHTIEWYTNWGQGGAHQLHVGKALQRNDGFGGSDYHHTTTAMQSAIFGMGYGFRIFIAQSDLTGGPSGTIETHADGDAAYIGFRNIHIARGGGAGTSIGSFTFYYSWLYDDEKIESDLTKINTTPITLYQESDFKYAPYIRRDFDHNRRITGARIYFQKDGEQEKFFMQEIDFIKGTKAIGEEEYSSLSIASRSINSITAYQSTNTNHHGTNGIEWKNKVMTYQSNVGTSDVFRNYKYKTSLILNRRMYIGNIGEIDASGKVIKRMGDRMMKSSVNQFDKFPENNFVDVAVNDGEEITHLAHFADRILQFKGNDLYIINISGDYEFLEGQHKHIGVLNKCQVTSTEVGVIWVNNRGLYLYDGNQIHNLIEGRIDENNFGIDESLRPSIAYDALSKKVIICKQTTGTGSGTFASGWSFCLKTFSFIALQANFNNTTTSKLTNFINTNDGKVLWANQNNIYQWSDLPNNDINTTSTNNKKIQFITKDFDFEDPSTRKKISKIYVTYNAANTTDSAWYITYAKDGTESFEAYSELTGLSFYDNTGSDKGFLKVGSDSRKIAEIKPTSPLTVKSLQLRFQLETESHTNVEKFEIEDITIVYRTKTIK